MSTPEKINKIIDLKCGGNPTRLAEILEVQRSYISKLKNGTLGMGMTQLKRLMIAFPDINPRWLILDDPDEVMIDRKDLIDIRMKLYENIKTMLDIEHYLPFMSKEELDSYKDSVKGIKPFDFSDSQIDRWKSSLTKSAGGVK